MPPTQKVSFKIHPSFGFFFRSQVYRFTYNVKFWLTLGLSVFCVWVGLWLPLQFSFFAGCVYILTLFMILFLNPLLVSRRLKKQDLQELEYIFEKDRFQGVSKIDSFEVKRSAVKDIRFHKSALLIKLSYGADLVFALEPALLKKLSSDLKELGWL